jgi:hypothetical protein
MKSILDRSFRYRKSYETDVEKTFARVRRQQQRRAQAQAAATDEARSKVLTITQRKKEAVS